MTVPLHEPTTLPPADYGGNAQPNMTLDAIYADYKNSSAQLLPVRQQMVALAAKWGLKHTSYEAGPGWNVGCVRERSTRAVCRPPCHLDLKPFQHRKLSRQLHHRPAPGAHA